MSILQRGGPGSAVLVSRLNAVPEEDVATTIVSYEEQARGWLARTARAKDEALVRAYEQLGQHLDIYAGMQVLVYDKRAHAIVQTLRNRGLRTGTQDLKIAAIAIAHGATVLSRNTVHFMRVPDLRTEDWAS
jgi:tRNA(fMet)-specific endonuclease VapC